MDSAALCGTDCPRDEKCNEKLNKKRLLAAVTEDGGSGDENDEEDDDDEERQVTCVSPKECVCVCVCALPTKSVCVLPI